jgi:hypothetical protein
MTCWRPCGGRAGVLGSLVLIKTLGSSRAQVVDGQQRLTTLTLLFAALRDMIGREDVRAALEKLVVEPGDPLRNLVEQPRLTVWEAHRDFFAKHVTLSGGLPALDSEQALAGAQELVRLNSRLFIRRLEVLPEEERIELARYLVSNTYLVVVSTPDEGSAHRIFAVMNDRGMQLSHTDILKALRALSRAAVPRPQVPGSHRIPLLRPHRPARPAHDTGQDRPRRHHPGGTARRCEGSRPTCMPGDLPVRDHVLHAWRHPWSGWVHRHPEAATSGPARHATRRHPCRLSEAAVKGPAFHPHVAIAYANANVPATEAILAVQEVNSTALRATVAIYEAQLVLLEQRVRSYAWDVISPIPLTGRQERP